MTELSIIFLGTTGSIPTPSRSLPAIAIKRGKELLLWDCGEGTQSQMLRAHLSPMKVDAIFISHLHGDHFLGLAGLVQTMSLMYRTNPLYLYCPAGERERLETYLRIPHYTLTFDVVIQELSPGAELRRGDYRILTSDVDHPVPALAYALVEDDLPGHLDPKKAIALGIKPGPDLSRLKSGQSIKLLDGQIISPEQVLGPTRPGRKIVYTGDTRPSERIVQFAGGADVLIHDCTLADELADNADENAHSNPSRAAGVAKRAGVKRLVLIHISPRYEDDSLLLEQAKKIFPNTIAARDLTVLKIPFTE